MISASIMKQTEYNLYFDLNECILFYIELRFYVGFRCLLNKVNIKSVTVTNGI